MEKEADPNKPLQRIPTDAATGIKPYGLLSVAMLPLLPSEARILTKDVVRRGDYTLVPHSRMASDGTYELIYFLAYRSGPEDFEYIVGPASLNERSEEHTSELQSLMRISYAVFCLKKKIIKHIST